MKELGKNSENTTLSTIPRLISQVLPIYEVNAKQLFSEANLDLQKLLTTDTRVPMEQMAKLWQLAVDATENPQLGLIAASLFQPAYIKGLGLAWMASENLVEGLKLFVANTRLVNTAFQIELESKGDDLIIKYKASDQLQSASKVHPCAIQLGVGFFLKMFRLAAGKSIPSSGVFFNFPITEHFSVYQQYFNCPVHTNSEFNGIAFSFQLLSELLPTHDEGLVDLNKEAVNRYLASLDQGVITAKVGSTLTSLLPSGCPTEEEVAYRLHMSKRTLQRKLKSEGQAYSTLLSLIRSKLARKYLSSTENSITDIAYQLGYSSPSAFARAFKQQLNLSPLEYRKLN